MYACVYNIIRYKIRHVEREIITNITVNIET